MVHQHFMLIPRFTVLENVMLGSEGGALLSKGRISTANKLKELGQTFDMEVDPYVLVSDLNVGMRQRVEILKALKGGAKILILDEPTGVLTPQEATQLFEILDKLRENGVTVLLITHKLAEIMAITDNVSIMRGGEMVGHRKTSDTNPQELAELMVGRELVPLKKGIGKAGEIIMKVGDTSVKDDRGLMAVKKINFELFRGEILGIAGIDGNGQKELVEAIAGVRDPESGEIEISGMSNSGREKSRLIGHVTEDRHHTGIIMQFSLSENFALKSCDTQPFGDWYKLNINTMREHMEAFDVRPNNPNLMSSNFSGGNQQKLVMARELGLRPKLLLAAQPTRGLDVGATEYVHQRLIEARDDEMAILLVSTELEEILTLSDRIMVMYEGEIMGLIDSAEAERNILGLMMAGTRLESIRENSQ